MTKELIRAADELKLSPQGYKQELPRQTKRAKVQQTVTYQILAQKFEKKGERLEQEEGNGAMG